MDVLHTLAAACAEEACDLCIRLALDPEEHLWLREILVGDFPSWKERVSDKLLLTLMTDPIPAVCTAVMEVWCYRSSQIIPLHLILPYLRHEGKHVRETAIKTLMAAKQHVPIEQVSARGHSLREACAQFPGYGHACLYSALVMICKQARVHLTEHDFIDSFDAFAFLRTPFFSGNNVLHL
ncbi:hypothetical protein KSB_93810 [Ktedonobacter robiniae]|uniref:PBS lyase n=1 Tax=Ktedonobacter robiniae TaxID=2778365 RepID=A0ABQ3V6P1_9CHLR|nr:hypothetical protein KSB_93810 [Ktedonobacter robiniae]